MAVIETAPAQAEYQEPEPDGYDYEPKEEVAGQLALKASGFRICAINEGMATLEPLQEGVLRYPPVQIEVPRNPDSINSYIHMGPYINPDSKNT